MALGRVPIEPGNAGYATLKAPVEHWNSAATPGRRHQAPNKNRYQKGGQGGSTCDHINGTSTAADGAAFTAPPWPSALQPYALPWRPRYGSSLGRFTALR